MAKTSKGHPPAKFPTNMGHNVVRSSLKGNKC